MPEFMPWDVGRTITFSTPRPRVWHPIRLVRYLRRRRYDRLHPPRIVEVRSNGSITWVQGLE